MKKSQSKKEVTGPKIQNEESKTQIEYVDLFKLSLERAFGRKVSDEEAREMDEILSGRSSEDSFE
jgi:hypothetical protein